MVSKRIYAWRGDARFQPDGSEISAFTSVEIADLGTLDTPAQPSSITLPAPRIEITLENARFVWPTAREGKVSLSRAQLAMLMEGIDWRMPQKTWRPRNAEQRHVLLMFLLLLDSHEARNLIEDRMSRTPPNLADLPPDVQAFVAAQEVELARKDTEILGLSLTHAAAQDRL